MTVSFCLCLCICHLVYISVCNACVLLSVSTCPSIRRCFYLSVCMNVTLCLFLYICLYIYMYVSLCLSLRVFLSVCVSVYQICLYVYFCLSVCLHLSFCLFVCLHPSVCLSIWQSISASLFTSQHIHLPVCPSVSSYLCLHLTERHWAVTKAYVECRRFISTVVQAPIVGDDRLRRRGGWSAATRGNFRHGGGLGGVGWGQQLRQGAMNDRRSRAEWSRRGHLGWLSIASVLCPPLWFALDLISSASCGYLRMVSVTRAVCKCLSVCLSVFLSVCLSVYFQFAVCLTVCLSACLPCCLRRGELINDPMVQADINEDTVTERGRMR